MKFSHCEDKRRIDISTFWPTRRTASTIVSRLGTRLITLARINEAGEWTGFLYRDNEVSAPSQGWANYATVMGYYLHRLKNGRSLRRSAQRTLDHCRSNRRAVPDIVVRWRTISLHGNRVGDWSITTNSALLKIRKASKQFRPAADWAPLSA